MSKFNDIDMYAQIYRDTFVNESIDPIRDSDVSEHMQMQLETPGGMTTLTLDGDYDTNLWLAHIIHDALENKIRRERQESSVMFYVKK